MTRIRFGKIRIFSNGDEIEMMPVRFIFSNIATPLNLILQKTYREVKEVKDRMAQVEWTKSN